MSQRNPASILLDIDGNLVGVMYDGVVHRLQVETVVSDPSGASAAIEATGTRLGLAVQYPELLAAVGRLEAALERIHAQLAEITGDEEPMT